MNKSTKKEIDGFIKVCNEMIVLKTRKAGDYGNAWRVGGIQPLFVEISRKFYRILINKNKETLNNETLRDSLIDIAVYAIMSIQLIDEKDTEDKIYKILTK